MDLGKAIERVDVKGRYCNIGVLVNDLGPGRVMLYKTCPEELKQFASPSKPERFNAVPVDRSLILSLKRSPNAGTHYLFCILGGISVSKISTCYPELFGPLEGLSDNDLKQEMSYGDDFPGWKWHLVSSRLAAEKPAAVFPLVPLLYIHVLYYKRTGGNFFSGRNVNCLLQGDGVDGKIVSVNFFKKGVVTITPYRSSDLAPYVTGTALSWD